MMNRFVRRISAVTPFSGAHALLNRKVTALSVPFVRANPSATFESARQHLSTLGRASQQMQRVAPPSNASKAVASIIRSVPLRSVIQSIQSIQSIPSIHKRMYTRPSLRSLMSAKHPVGAYVAWIAGRNVSRNPWDLKLIGEYLLRLNSIERHSAVIAAVNTLASEWHLQPNELSRLHPIVQEQTNIAFHQIAQRSQSQSQSQPQPPPQPPQPPSFQPTAEQPVTPTPQVGTPQVAVGGAGVGLGSIFAQTTPQQNVSDPAAPQQPQSQPSGSGSGAGAGAGAGAGPAAQAFPSLGADSRFGVGSEVRPLHVRQVPIAPTGFDKIRAALSVALLLLLLYTLFMMLSPQSRLGGKSIVKEAGGADGLKVTTKFKDVKGCDEAKAELDELVRFLRNPSKFNSLGGKMPRGVLLMGPPGTGKTLLAKAVAGEAGVPFFYCSGSEFEEMFVGVGARRVRDLFDAAKHKSPALIFIDEIDAVGGKRQMRGEHNRMTLNQLLTEMDGFQSDSKVVVIGATNFAKSLDPALMRPGRFDKHVEVPLPDIKGRKEILDLYLAKTPKSADVNTEVIARGTPGCSGADLFNLVNSAAVRAASKGLKAVSLEELEYAKDKVLMGAERKSTIIPEEVRRLTAYHEGGHALMALLTPGAMPLHKATIIPRGPALGLTHQLPEERNMYQRTKHELQAELDVCMGGRVAEELIFGSDHVTTGASSDMERATKTARSMVMKWGMSDRIGLRMIDDQDRALGSEVRQTIDEEVTKILAASHARTKAVLSAQPALLHGLAAELLKSETLSADQMREVVSKYRTATPATSAPPPQPATTNPIAAATATVADVVSQIPTAPAPQAAQLKTAA